MSKSWLGIVETRLDYADSRSEKVVLGIFGGLAFTLVLVVAMVCANIVAHGLRDAGRTAGTEAGKNITNAIQLQMRLQKKQLQRLRAPGEERASIRS